MRKWLKKLWNAFKPIKASDIGKKPEVKIEEPDSDVQFSPCWYTYGAHMYRSQGERVDVSFINPKSGNRKLIVDNNGYIRNFPGIKKEDSWIGAVTSDRYLKPQVRFRSEFSRYDENRYMMLWQIQPDGRYWADDDGFGMENDDEIMLYSFIDKNGDFMGPFQVYCVGDKRYLERPE